MRIGIVGSEEAKFTKVTAILARSTIRRILVAEKATLVVSGSCHLGGIDIWAEEEAAKMEIPTSIFPPKVQNWEGGYKPRNILIAENSDIVYCITVLKLPEGYTGMRFPKCYHCAKHGEKQPHVKSDGCWTMWYAKSIGKGYELVVI